MSDFVMIFGRRHHERCRALGAGVRKSPKNETAGEVRTAVPRSAYQRAPEAGFLYNLSVMARRLVNGGK
jgi:hypothetical protein